MEATGTETAAQVFTVAEVRDLGGGVTDPALQKQMPKKLPHQGVTVSKDWKTFLHFF